VVDKLTYSFLIGATLFLAWYVQPEINPVAVHKVRCGGTVYSIATGRVSFVYSPMTNGWFLTKWGPYKVVIP